MENSQRVTTSPETKKNFLFLMISIPTVLLIVAVLPLSGNALRNLQSEARALWFKVAPPTVLIESFPATAALKKGESVATVDGKFLLSVNSTDGTITVTTPFGTTKQVAIAKKHSFPYNTYNEIIFDGLYAVLMYDYGDQVQFEIRELSSSLSPGSYADGIVSITPSDGNTIPLKGVITLALNGSGSCNERLYYLDMFGEGTGGGQSVVVPKGTCKPYIEEIPFEYSKTGENYIFLVERISTTLKRTVEQKNVVVVSS